MRGDLLFQVHKRKVSAAMGREQAAQMLLVMHAASKGHPRSNIAGSTGGSKAFHCCFVMRAEER
jgi:hypothetical protein